MTLHGVSLCVEGTKVAWLKWGAPQVAVKAEPLFYSAAVLQRSDSKNVWPLMILVVQQMMRYGKLDCLDKNRSAASSMNVIPPTYMTTRTDSFVFSSVFGNAKDP